MRLIAAFNKWRLHRAFKRVPESIRGMLIADGWSYRADLSTPKEIVFTKPGAFHNIHFS